MYKSRMEAFSDGVIAIIITIMVLELKVPHGETLATLQPLIPVALSYIMSFIYLGIYWNNHHHLLQATQSVSGVVLWANLHLLFWLSLIPFATGWMADTHFAPTPVAIYGSILLMAGVAYFLLSCSLLHRHGTSSTLGKAIGSERKEKISVVMYLAAVVLAFVSEWIAIGLYILVAAMWIIPDRRIEHTLKK